jgi:SPOR domain
MKQLVLLSGFFIWALAAAAQTVPAAPAAAPVNDSNTVVVKKDPRLEALVKKQIEVNKKAGGDDNDDKGFRLMILTTNKRDEAVAARSTLYTYFPELKNYLFYQAPYYKLKAGNFKNRDEADKYRKKMASYFPRGVFIMPDKIELSQKDKDKDKKEDSDK